MSFRIEIKIHFFESTCTFLLLEITKKKKKETKWYLSLWQVKIRDKRLIKLIIYIRASISAKIDVDFIKITYVHLLLIGKATNSEICRSDVF